MRFYALSVAALLAGGASALPQPSAAVCNATQQWPGWKGIKHAFILSVCPGESLAPIRLTVVRTVAIATRRQVREALWYRNPWYRRYRALTRSRRL